MKTLRKFSAFSALYMAAAYLIGMAIFLAILDYPSITDPAQAAITWQGIEAVTGGLGNGNGEILGGLWTLLVSLAALRAGGLSKGLNILGLFAGTVGIFSLITGLTDLTGAFGLSHMIWFVWLGIVLLRGKPGPAEQRSSSLFINNTLNHPYMSTPQKFDLDIVHVTSSTAVMGSSLAAGK